MDVTENDRLDLRQALTQTLGSEHLAAVAMQAMPPLDYDSFATKTDLELLGRELRAEIGGVRGEIAELRGEMHGETSGLRGEIGGVRGEIAEVRGEIAELRGEMYGEFAKVRSEAAGNLRLMLAGQLATMVMLGGWMTAIV